MIVNSSKWDKVYKVFCGLPIDRRNRASALYHATVKLHRQANTQYCSEDAMERCLQTLGDLPQLFMADFSLEYEDAMTGDEIIANLTTERN